MGQRELLLQIAPERRALMADVFFAQFFLPRGVIQVLQVFLIVGQCFAAQQARQLHRQHSQRCFIEAAGRRQQRDEMLPVCGFHLRHHQHSIRCLSHSFAAATQRFVQRRHAPQQRYRHLVAQVLYRPLHPRQTAIDRAQGFMALTQFIQCKAQCLRVHGLGDRHGQGGEQRLSAQLLSTQIKGLLSGSLENVYRRFEGGGVHVECPYS